MFSRAFENFQIYFYTVAENPAKKLIMLFANNQHHMISRKNFFAKSRNFY